MLASPYINPAAVQHPLKGRGQNAQPALLVVDTQAFVVGEEQLERLAQHEYGADEEALFKLLSKAQGHMAELERSPPSTADPHALDAARHAGEAIVRFCVAWFRFAASGGLTEDGEGLRGSAAAELACSTITAAVSQESALGRMLLARFDELGGLGLFGAALVHMDEARLVIAARRLRKVATRCGVRARREGSNYVLQALTSNVEAFHGGLFARLVDLALRPGRRLRVSHFKELVAELGGVLSGVYDTNQVFEMGCLLSLQLTAALANYCPGVPETDALEAVEWMASVMRNLLDQPSATGALASPVAVREWINDFGDFGLWQALLYRSGCRTLYHAHHLFTVLLFGNAMEPRDLVGALAAAGALTPSAVPAPCRLAFQGALVATVPSLDPRGIVELFSELSSTLAFVHVGEEGVDLIVQITQQAFVAGFIPRETGPETALPQSLGLSYLLYYLQWGYTQAEPPENLLELARHGLLRSLAPQPVAEPVLPALAAKALILAAAPANACTAAAAERCVRGLCGIAVGLARMGAAAVATKTQSVAAVTAAAIATICTALPIVGSDTPFGGAEAQTWVAAFADCLACFLRLPGSHIDTPQVGSLWSRMIVRPVFGLQVPEVSMQYFKLAFLAQPSASSALIAPFLVAQNSPREVQLAYYSIFCPASLIGDPPPLSARFFLPDDSAPHAPGAATVDMSGAGAPVSEDSYAPFRLPQPLRRSLPSAMQTGIGAEEDALLVDAAAIAAVAVAAGHPLPDASSSAPRMRLDRIQAVARDEATLLGELAAYDAIERRLWDEFDERGRVDDSDALWQRDAAAARCLSVLELELKRHMSFSRDLPPSLEEARDKFSRLCDLLSHDTLGPLGHDLCKLEEQHAVREADALDARARHAREAAHKRRHNGAAGAPSLDTSNPAAEAAKAAQNAYLATTAQLVAAVRRVAYMAQVGLVEVVGTMGLARALRAAGSCHDDPLLGRLQQHGPWVAAQRAADTWTGETEQLAPTDACAVGSSALAAKPTRRDTAPRALRLQRPDGLAAYGDVRSVSSSGSVLSGTWRGCRMVLKGFKEGREDACQRELRALAALQHRCIVTLQGTFCSGGTTYLEFAWCAGGNLLSWCDAHTGVLDAQDVAAYVKCVGIIRDVWNAVAYVHGQGAVHGNVSLSNILLTADHRPLLCDFGRCCFLEDAAGDGVGMFPPEPGYMAPEQEAAGSTPPTKATDVYATGVAMAKAFLGLRLDVSGCPYHPTRQQRSLPDERIDVDMADLIHATLEESPLKRPSSDDAASHRALDPMPFLRRRGVLGGNAVVGGSNGRAGKSTPGESLLSAAEQLREEYRGKRVDEPLMFSRDAVFETIAKSSLSEWAEDALLGEWRVMLNDESGVDGGGLRREVVSLFFEQFEQSSLVIRAGAEGPNNPPTLFVAGRQQADCSPQQWRQMWASVGAMALRAVVHFGNAPIAFSSIVFDCVFGRIDRLPPDDTAGGAGPADKEASARLAQFRAQRGDDWARSELLDWLRRLRRADPMKESSYRWMLAQRASSTGSRDGEVYESGRGGVAYTLSSDALQTMDVMLDPLCFDFLVNAGHAEPDGSTVHHGSILEWALLWDIYLKYVGGCDRWLAYEAFAQGLTSSGRRSDMWAALTGDQMVQALEGAALTPDIVIANLEFKPSYGYDQQVQCFRRVMESFSGDELSMFLRFATGIGRLPASRKFPSGQKLQIRFIPDNLDRLPSAHTCFWVVDVPPYEEEADMGQKLRQAIAAPQPFALS